MGINCHGLEKALNHIFLAFSINTFNIDYGCFIFSFLSRVFFDLCHDEWRPGPEKWKSEREGKFAYENNYSSLHSDFYN